MPRGQLGHAVDQGLGRGHHRVEGQVLVQRRRVERGIQISAPQQCRQARGKAQALGPVGQVQGLDAQSVPGQEQTAAVPFPDRQGEHAVQAFEHLLAPGMVGLEYHLGIAIGEELIAEDFQLAAQRGVVVDGPVEHQGQPQLIVHHGLTRGLGQVHDLQAAVGQGHRPAGPEPGGVRAAVDHLSADTAQGLQIGQLSIEAQFPCQSTHLLLPRAPARLFPND